MTSFVTPARLALITLLCGLGVLASLTGPSSSRSAVAPADPYNPPIAQDVNADPRIFETTISAQAATIDINTGTPVRALTFNGSVPGPAIRAEVGDTVIVHYENHLDEPSAIHWHGVEVPNSMDGTPLTQDMVKPGDSFIYKFKVTRPGIFWYHPHHHSSTNQVFKGLYGALIVQEPAERKLQNLKALPPTSRTFPVVFSDMTVCKAPGSNDDVTYSPGAPHVSGSPLPAQAPPTPRDLCETSPVDAHGAPRGPFAAGDIPNIQQAAVDGRTNEGQTVLTNGVNVGRRGGTPQTPGFLDARQKTFPINADEEVRLQMVNASTVRYMRLHLTTGNGARVPLLRVGGEGGLLDRAILEGGTSNAPLDLYDTNYKPGEIVLPPGGRADVVAQMRGVAGNSPADAGTYTMWTEDFLRSAAGFAGLPSVPVMHFAVAPAPAAPSTGVFQGMQLRDANDLVEKLPLTADKPLDPATFSPLKNGLASSAISMTTNGTQLGFDGHAGTHDAPGPSSGVPHMDSARYVLAGQILELTVANKTGTRHPFHLHGFSIQPIRLTKSGFPTYNWFYNEFVDTVDVPPGYTLRFRVRIDHRPTADERLTAVGGEAGRWVMHCHIFFHAESGMLSELVVVDPASAGHERPDVSSDDGTVTGIRGRQASMSGSFADRENEQVSFLPPHDVQTGELLGTVGKLGGSHGVWRWTYAVAADDHDRLIAITVVDGSGVNSAIFALKTQDPPPPAPTPTPGTSPAPEPTPPPGSTQAPPAGTTPPAPGGPAAGADTAAPVIGGLRARRLRTGGERFRLRLSEPARVVITVARTSPPARRRVGRIARQAAGGVNRLVLRKRLRRGRYRATAIAIDAAGNRSRRARVRFAVKATRRAG